MAMAEAKHDGYQALKGAPLDHKRRLSLSCTGLIICDTLAPCRSVARAISYEVRFLLHPDAVATTTRSGTFQIERLGVPRLAFKGTEELDWSVKEGAYAPVFGTRVPCQVLMGKGILQEGQSNPVTLSSILTVASQQ